MMDMHKEEVLVNQKIVAIYEEKDFNQIFFKTAEGRYIVLDVFGDCCSHASIEEINALLPLELNGSYEETQESAEPTTQECDTLYEVIFGVNEGYLKIVHRNSSNGYYGNSWMVSLRDELSDKAERKY